eukprot:CAMPEP_0172907448 /NCGR_PEP_ID=MMETSP1075-20121228/178850_1 /TAXON_ID=2916 /ORGANISM="Ceratium fusus, Strain PA161109" /LENGTH=132 /DNA_ID=CAMNT_0013765063 /DNA_START=59 /DNA_END=453 /DNA_ORIENTATION=-
MMPHRDAPPGDLKLRCKAGVSWRWDVEEPFMRRLRRSAEWMHLHLPFFRRDEWQLLLALGLVASLIAAVGHILLSTKILPSGHVSHWHHTRHWLGLGRRRGMWARITNGLQNNLGLIAALSLCAAAAWHKGA